MTHPAAAAKASLQPSAPAVAAAVPVAGDAALAIDGAAIAAVSLAICSASHRLAFMTVFVPLVIGLRVAAWTRLPADQRWGPLRAEIAFLAICAALGAFNDWNSVVRHRIYDYDVPVYFPRLSTIPLWMLLSWGMILRAAATLCRWQRLTPPPQPRDDIHLPGRVVESAGLKVVILLLLVLATRQGIYRYALDPILSWTPFAAALLAYAALFRPGRYEQRLGLLVLVAGPAIEILYIHVGRLHHYHLGWLGGVPLWIALWWVLAVWVWSDLSVRLQLEIGRRLARHRRRLPAPGAVAQRAENPE